jgi:hypothetical protein
MHRHADFQSVSLVWKFDPRNPIIGKAHGSGGRPAPNTSSRQLKEVIQVAHSHVGSVASPAILARREVHI